MVVELIAAENLNSLTELVIALWDDCSFEEEFENYKSLIGADNEICYLIKETQEYIGFAHASIRNDYVEGSNSSPVAYLEAIYVKPNYRDRGIAKVLIGHIEDWAKKKGLTQIASDTAITNNAAILFHKKAGFSEAEKIVCFIKNL